MRTGCGSRERTRAFCVPVVVLSVLLVGSVATSVLTSSARATSAAPGPQPVRSFRAGDIVWMSTPPTVVLAPMGTGCQRVPATGYIGPNVYAQTTGQYSSYWSWSASSSVEPFHWYVFTSGGALKANGASGGGGGSTLVPANINYWKTQNQGRTPQAWNVCWSG